MCAVTIFFRKKTHLFKTQASMIVPLSLISGGLVRFPRILILMALFPFLTLAAVIFTPAFPGLMAEFQLKDSEAQWMMTLFLFGTALGRLPYGPLANRFGRKPALLLGLCISVIGTLLTIFSGSYLFVCLGRFVQAFGCAAALKIGQTMIGDLLSGAEATKVFSYGAISFAFVPAFGTAVAGLLTPFWGWRGGFWFFLIFTILLILSLFFLPETVGKKDPAALQVKRIISAYADQFRNRSLVLWGCLLGLSTAIVCIFAQQAPFIASNLMGISSQEYGMLTMVPAFGVVFGSLLTTYLANRVDSARAIFVGILVILIGTCFMTGFLKCSWISGWALFLPQAIIQLGDAILYANVSSRGLSEAKDKSNASAIMLFVTGLVAILGTYLVGVFVPKSLLSLPLVFGCIVALMLAIWARALYIVKIFRIGE